MNSRDFYNANPNIKREGVKTNWTPELVEEYQRCMNDPVYFAETYCKVINLDEGLVNFKLYPYQKDMFKHFSDNRFSIVLACRQSGKCSGYDTKIKIKNKHTGEIQEISMGVFHKLLKHK